CGGTFTSLEGTFQSPGFPNNYTNNARCYYRISQPEGYRITLTFHHFDIYNTPEDACEDYVMVHDGNSDASPRIYSDIGSICNPVKTPVVRRSTGNQMLVQFCSDHNFTATGFNATYTSANFEEDFMLAGNVGTNEIIRLDMETLSYIKIPVADVTSPKDIVYDPVDDRIYWTANKTIETAVLHGAYKSVLPNLDNEDAEYDGIALDILARRLFYTDAGNDVIGDIRIPDYEYRTFITSGLDQPRDIVLHTGMRVMFWTDVGKEPKIERANYDGTKRVAIIQNLKQPNALSIDLKNERLYWTETGLVASSDLYGRDQWLIHVFDPTVHVFGMALHGNQIYFTDWSSNKSVSSWSFLRRVNFDGTDETELMHFNGHLYDIHIYTSTSLPEPDTTEATVTEEASTSPDSNPNHLSLPNARVLIAEVEDTLNKTALQTNQTVVDNAVMNTSRLMEANIDKGALSDGQLTTTSPNLAISARAVDKQNFSGLTLTADAGDDEHFQEGESSGVTINRFRRLPNYETAGNSAQDSHQLVSGIGSYRPCLCGGDAELHIPQSNCLQGSVDGVTLQPVVVHVLDVRRSAVSMVLHFSLLSSMCWMSVEAFYMYLAFVRVFRSNITHFMLKASCFGWGVPLVIVAVTVGVNTTDNYALLDSGICWLTGVAFYVAFVAPVCLILLFNVISFLLVLRVILGMTNNKLNSTQSTQAVQKIRRAVGVIILLGLTWVFGFLAIDGATQIGLFIFLFYCVFNKDARAACKRCFR
ncbi:hypothetical protein BaRGS_00020609, partial [Batillaria attramentaria]